MEVTEKAINFMWIGGQQKRRYIRVTNKIGELEHITG